MRWCACARRWHERGDRRGDLRTAAAGDRVVRDRHPAVADPGVPAAVGVDGRDRGREPVQRGRRAEADLRPDRLVGVRRPDRRRRARRADRVRAVGRRDRRRGRPSYRDGRQQPRHRDHHRAAVVAGGCRAGLGRGGPRAVRRAAVIRGGERADPQRRDRAGGADPAADRGERAGLHGVHVRRGLRTAGGGCADPGGGVADALRDRRGVAGRRVRDGAAATADAAGRALDAVGRASRHRGGPAVPERARRADGVVPGRHDRDDRRDAEGAVPGDGRAHVRLRGCAGLVVRRHPAGCAADRAALRAGVETAPQRGRRDGRDRDLGRGGVRYVGRRRGWRHRGAGPAAHHSRGGAGVLALHRSALRSSYCRGVDWLSIVGWGGAALVVVSLLQTRILRLRVLNLVGCVVLIAFNAAIEVWPMVGMNIVLAVINAVHLWRLVRDRHDDAEYAVLEATDSNAYLRHVLETHAQDIARFNPGFAAAALRAGYAFLVQRGERTVGVVLADDAGSGTAQVTLDYVLPEYRDFTPGEFVYRRSEVFTRHGFTRVIAPSGMRDSAAYLRKVGFHRDDDRLVLDLPPAPA